MSTTIDAAIIKALVEHIGGDPDSVGTGGGSSEVDVWANLTPHSSVQLTTTAQGRLALTKCDTDTELDQIIPSQTLIRITWSNGDIGRGIFYNDNNDTPNPKVVMYITKADGTIVYRNHALEKDASTGNYLFNFEAGADLNQSVIASSVDMDLKVLYLQNRMLQCLAIERVRSYAASIKNN